MDRFARGLTAGIIGGLVMNVWSFLSFYWLKISDLRFLDWAAVMVFGSLPRNNFETVFSQLTQIAWAGSMGVFFSFLVRTTTSKYLLIKGVWWGFLSGFAMFAVPVLFKTPVLKKVKARTALSNTIGGILWGASAACVLLCLETWGDK